MGEGTSDAHVFVVNTDGSGVKDLGPGAMPSWSPDDKRITFSHYSSPQSVWIMNADGSDRHEIEGGGAWSAKWSPRAGEIAYIAYGEARLCIYDVAKKEHRELEHRAYQTIYWGQSWSPDGKWLCFKGVLPDGGNEIAALSVEGEAKGLKVLLPSSAQPEVDNCNMTMSWGGNGRQILVAMKRKGDRTQRLYLLDSEGVKPPRLFANFPAGWTCNDASWSPDGKRVVMSARAVEIQPPKAK
jgi:Tol biopolymer transport system component